MTIRILLDPGSQLSFCTEKVVKMLRAPTIKRSMTFVAMGNHVQETTEAIRLTIKSRISPHQDTFIATILKELTGVIHSVPYDPQQKFSSLQNKTMADSWPQKDGVTIDAIIGQDTCWQIMGLNFYHLPHRGAEGLVFADTPYGVLMQGADREKKKLKPAIVSVLSNPLAVPGVKKEKKTEPVLEKLLRDFFCLESMGIKKEEETTLTVRQQWATDYLRDNMKFDKKTKKCLHHQLPSGVMTVPETDGKRSVGGFDFCYKSD